MKAIHLPAESREYRDHPRFSGVRIAMLIKGVDSESVSVSELIIEPGVQVPVHTHDTQADSIYITEGSAQAFVNGHWTDVAAGDYIFVPPGVEHSIRNSGTHPLRLFIHHSPPLF